MLSLKSNSKGDLLVLNTLLRLIVAIFLLFIVFKVGKSVSDALFGGSDALESLDSLVEEINSMQELEAKPFLLSLDKGNAVIGFSQSAAEFRCNLCTNFRTPKINYYVIQKPVNEQCSSKSCTCFCSELTQSRPIETDSEIRIPLTCQKMTCQSLRIDLAQSLSLEGPIKNRKAIRNNYPSWQNGFMFTRKKDGNTPSNGMPTPQFDRRIPIQLEKIRQSNLIAVCPETSCSQLTSGGGSGGGW